MADIALVTAGRIEVVASWQQFTLPPDESITPGQAVRGDATSGKATKSKATSAGEAATLGLALSPSARNLGVTVLRKGIVDGYDLSGLDYGDLVYLSDTDGRLADAAGTVPVAIGRVIRGDGKVGGDGKKLLLVDVQTIGDIDLTSLTIAGGDTLVITDADALIVGGLIVPQHLEITYRQNANGDIADEAFFIANHAYQVTAVREIHATAGDDSGAVSAQVTKDTGTNAPGAGTNLLTNNTGAGFNLKGTANTVQAGTLSATPADLQLAAGDRLSVDFAGTLSTLAGVVVTVSLKRI